MGDVTGLPPGLFDDGTSDVPEGAAGPVDRVLVVGAGIAGLTVANALHHAGMECVVLEARGRVGGRLHTVDLQGSPVDLGGSWLHHPSGNPLRRFAGETGIACRPGDPLPGLAGFDLATQHWLTPEELDASTAADAGAFIDALNGLRARLGPDASAADGIESFVAATALTGDRRRRAAQALRASVEADAAGAAEQQSLRWLWTQDEYDDAYFGDLPEEGYAAVVGAMASGLDVRLDWPVARVELVDEGVRVTSERGHTETGSHVVVAVPLGVLQDGRPTFTPPLPSARSEVIARLGFGRYEKVVLRFAEPFWRKAGWSHLVLFPTDPAEPAAWVFDLDAFGLGPILACHVFHSTAARLATATPDAAARWMTDRLAAVLGGSCPEPVAVAVTGWAADPFAGGAYTHVPPGASNADLDLLGTPVAGRILFAGEHTQSARVGYADGAMTSGIREAKRLLRAPAVRLARGDLSVPVPNVGGMNRSTASLENGAHIEHTELRDVSFHHVRFTGLELVDVEITGRIEGVTVNGVDIGPLVDAELDRRMPERAKMRPETVEEFQEAWAALEQLWAGTEQRARALPPELLHERVGGEWSFIETLRHLGFASAAWVARMVLGDPVPWHPLDLPWDEAPGWDGIPWDRDARPSLDQVLAVRRKRQAMVRKVIAALTPEQLESTVTQTEPGWPQLEDFPLRQCLFIVVNEEWHHRLYAERDLDALEAASD